MERREQVERLRGGGGGGGGGGAAPRRTRTSRSARGESSTRRPSLRSAGTTTRTTGETFRPARAASPIIRDLEKGNFTFKMITLIDDDLYYATYVKQVPFDGSVRRTNNLLNGLNRMRTDIKSEGKHTLNSFEKHTLAEHPSVRLNVNDEAVGVSKDFLEKQSIQWLSIAQVQVPPLRRGPPAGVRVPGLVPPADEGGPGPVRGRVRAFEPLGKIFPTALQKGKRRRPWKPKRSLPIKPTKPTQSTEAQFESNSTSGARTSNPPTVSRGAPSMRTAKCSLWRTRATKFVAIHLGHQEQKVKCPVAQVRVPGFF